MKGDAAVRLNLANSPLDGNCELLLFGHHHEYGLWHASRLMVTLIEIEKAGTKDVSLTHRIEIV